MLAAGSYVINSYNRPLGLDRACTNGRRPVTRVCVIGVARGGHGRAFALPSLNFALPSKPSFYLKFNVLCLLGLVVSAWLQLGNKFKV